LSQSIDIMYALAYLAYKLDEQYTSEEEIKSTLNSYFKIKNKLSSDDTNSVNTEAAFNDVIGGHVQKTQEEEDILEAEADELFRKAEERRALKQKIQEEQDIQNEIKRKASKEEEIDINPADDPYENGLGPLKAPKVQSAAELFASISQQ